MNARKRKSDLRLVCIDCRCFQTCYKGFEIIGPNFCKYFGGGERGCVNVF